MTGLGPAPDDSKLDLGVNEAALLGENSSGSNLGGANVAGANVGGANVAGSNVGGANIAGANLGGSNLGGANVGGNNLGGTNLAGSNLGGSNVAGSNLGGANVSGANVSGSNIAGNNLAGSNLSGSNVSGSNVSGANVSGNNLAGSNLSGSNFAANIHNLPSVTGMLQSGEDLYFKSGQQSACVVLGIGSTAFARLVEQNTGSTMNAAVKRLDWGFTNTAGGPITLKAWEVLVWGSDKYCSFVIAAPTDATYVGVGGFVKAVFRWNAPPSKTLNIQGMTAADLPLASYPGMMGAGAMVLSGAVPLANYLASEWAFISSTTNNQAVYCDWAAWVGTGVVDAGTVGGNKASGAFLLGNVDTAANYPYAEARYMAVDLGNNRVALAVQEALPAGTDPHRLWMGNGVNITNGIQDLTEQYDTWKTTCGAATSCTRTTPALTERVDVTNGANNNLGWFDTAQAADGWAGPFTVTASASQSKSMIQTMVLRPKGTSSVAANMRAMNSNWGPRLFMQADAVAATAGSAQFGSAVTLVNPDLWGRTEDFQAHAISHVLALKPSGATAPAFRAGQFDVFAVNSTKSFKLRRSTVVAGDVLVASVGFGKTMQNNVVNVTAPTGWALVRRQNFASVGSLAVYYRVATASEPWDYTWTFDVAVGGVGAISAYSGVSTSSPVHLEAGQALGYVDLFYSSPAVTTTVANTTLVASFFSKMGGGTNATFEVPSVTFSSGTPAAPAFRAASSKTSATGTTSFVVNRPTGLVAGDLMVATVGVTDSNPQSFWTASPPVGWAVLDAMGWRSNESQWVFYKVASAADTTTASYAFNFIPVDPGSFSVKGVAAIVAYSNVNPLTPFASRRSLELSLSGTALKSPRLRSHVANGLVVATYFNKSATASTTLTPPTAFGATLTKPVSSRCAGAIQLSTVFGEPVPAGKCDSYVSFNLSSGAAGANGYVWWNSSLWRNNPSFVGPYNGYMMIEPSIEGIEGEATGTVQFPLLGEVTVHTRDPLYGP